MVFIVDVEDRPETVVDIANVFRRDSIPATYFVVTQLVVQDSVIRDALTATGEVGSHTVDHRTMGGRTLQDQSIGLRRSFEDITGWTGRAPTGFRPPEESFDRHTLTAWARAGGTYVLARNENRAGSPEMHTTSRGQIVVIPRLFKDDYNVIVQDRAVRGERISEAFVEGADKLHAIGGVAVMAGHTQIIDTDRRRDAYRIVAQHARQQGGWWFARGDEVADWWLRKSRIVLRFDDRAANDTAAAYPDLLVSHPSDTVAGAWIDVQLPRGADGLTPSVDGRAVSFARTEWGMRVPVDTLFPGQARRIQFVGSVSAAPPR
jgi:peptidoglycan/xylan/chitin deacetylase (PgdA/CDA1 family)